MKTKRLPVRKLFLVSVMFFLSGLASCGPREYKLYAIADFCDSVQSGEYVVVSGVLKVPETILEYENNYTVMLVEDLERPTPYLRIGIPVGSGQNKMQSLPDGFALVDIKIQTNDGPFVTHGDAVRISGFHGGACGVGNSNIDVMLIESQK